MAEAKKTVESSMQKIVSKAGPKTSKKVADKVPAKTTVKVKKSTKVVKTAEKEAVKSTTEIIDALVEAEAVAEVIEEAKELSSVVDEKTAKAGDNPTKPLAKSGKRSAKAAKEVEEKELKEARKAETKEETADSKPKKIVKPPRSKLERRSKNYRKAGELIDKSKEYDLKEAVVLAQKTSSVKFDSTLELHLNLDVDPKQADQNIRGTVVLPGGTGKTSRVAVLVDDDQLDVVKKAGADLVGEEILGQLDKELIDFDVLISTPTMMAKLGKYARLLGPRGLMPNPKSGTVTTNVIKAVKESKAGRIEYRVDSAGIIHVAFGKCSFGSDDLVSNALAILGSVRSAKPASIKGSYIKSAYLSTTMGPSIKLNSNKLG